MKSRIFFIISMAAMLASLILLSFRDDGEQFAVVDSSGNAVLEISPDQQASFFVCLPESRIKEVPTSIDLKTGQTSQNLEILGPRPLVLPAKFAKKNSLEPRQQCAVSDLIKLEGEGQTQITAPQNSLVVAAVSSSNHIPIYIGLVFLFIIGLWGSFCINSKKQWTFRPHFRRYDAAIAFFFALLTAYEIAVIVTKITPPSDLLFPSYFEMLGLLICNFAGFLIVSCAIAYFRNKQKKTSTPTPENINAPTKTTFSPTESENAPGKANKSPDIQAEKAENLPSTAAETSQETEFSPDASLSTSKKPYTPRISIALGIALATIAAATVSFAPLPGLSTIEMASQLPSTCFMAAFFAILAGVSEECLFRGVIQTSLEAKPDSRHPMLQNAIAIGVATILFTSLHIEQSLDHLWALIPITCVSIVSGLLKIRYKSMYPSILLHMTYNATLLIPSILIYTQFVV